MYFFFLNDMSVIILTDIRSIRIRVETEWALAGHSSQRRQDHTWRISSCLVLLMWQVPVSPLGAPGAPVSVAAAEAAAGAPSARSDHTLNRCSHYIDRTGPGCR